MSAKRILVTGACGYCGPWIVQHLLAEGYDVVGVDRRPPTTDGDRALLHGADIRHFELLDERQLSEALADCAGVVHLAAHNSPLAAAPEQVFRDNTGLTATVLELAARMDVGCAVVASSTSVLGLTYAPQRLSPRYVPIDEDHPVQLLDPYALSKWVDEQTCRMVHGRTGLRVHALRFHWVAPPGSAMERAGGRHEDEERAARELWGYVDARDAARAVQLSLEADDVPFAIVNITADDSLASTPTRALMRRIHPDTVIRPELSGTESAWSNHRARELLGFAPSFSWRDRETASPDHADADIDEGSHP